ncbi:MAG TPA: 3-methyladenine DNA glycosylase, partial [Bacteroidales bacterium]|nr:3-methyladenine DNA glycosylase [Bacteroidales bacterium]
FFLRDVLEVAPEILGMNIQISQNGRLQSYMITEVEAYRGEEDLACHASRGRTARTEIMYHKGGHVYMYLIYGMYWMLNIVTGEHNIPQAILIRGVKGCNGPGRVGRLLNLDKTYYGEDLVLSERIWIEENPSKNNILHTTSKRIGIDYAGEKWKNKPWRYVLTE